jgi:glycerol-3-phosphate dehydrogenase
MSRRRLVDLYPMLERGDVTGGAYWYDGQMLDAVRVTLECVWDAVEAGAVAANHLECVSLLHGSGGVVGAVTRDKLTGREVEIRARVTINATGPWVDRVLALGPAAVRGERTTVWSRHINLVTRGLYPGDDALGVASQRASDAALGQAKRLFFTSPWRGLTIVGTTEHVYEGHPDAVAAPDDVVAGFLQEVSAAAPGFELQASDVYSVHLGLTPSEESESTRAKRSLLVDHEAVHGVPGLISVAGIKYTTAPVVAAKTLEVACRKLSVSPMMPAFERPAAAAAVTDLARLVAAQADSEGHDGSELAWTRRVYGTRAAACLTGSIPTGLDPAEHVFRSRVAYGASDEMIVRLADALLRATDWAERGLLTETQLTWCADTLQAAHGWTSERKQSELADARAALARLRVRLR